MQKTVVISLGGSLIAPGDIDSVFLDNFRKTVERYVRKGHNFVIICGGGSTARKYQESLRKLIGNDEEALDWIGIEATRLNASLVNRLFGRHSESEIITDPTKKITSKKPVLVASGWKPGRSTDYDAVLLAKQLKADSVINMSNVDYVYDKDPRRYNNVKKIRSMPWKAFINIVGTEWKAGLNAPFDPIAAREARISGIKAIIIGKKLSNLENLLDGKNFNGTVIG